MAASNIISGGRRGRGGGQCLISKLCFPLAEKTQFALLGALYFVNLRSDTQTQTQTQLPNKKKERKKGRKVQQKIIALQATSGKWV